MSSEIDMVCPPLSVLRPPSSERVRVAIVTAFPADPSSPCGGVEAVSVNLVRALARREELEIHVVTTDRECGANQVISWNHATIHRLPLGDGKLLSYAVGDGRRQIQAYLKQLGPDVVHAHDTFGLMVKGLALPRVFTIHGFIHEDTRYDGGKLSWLRAKLWRRSEIAGWRDQPHIISISPFVRERLRGVVSGQIHDIENPIGEEFFNLRATGGSGIIFCAAAMRRLKNTLGLLQAFEMLLRKTPHARLRLAGGESEPDYTDEVRRFIASHGLTDSVDLLGSISAERVREELSRADVFALVSFQENAPVGIAEAMAAGVPVVTSNRCGMPYMVRDGETGFLVNPQDRNEIAKRLGELLNNAALRTAMADRARKSALQRFHPDRVAESTRAVYCMAVRNAPWTRPCEC